MGGRGSSGGMSLGTFSGRIRSATQEELLNMVKKLQLKTSEAMFTPNGNVVAYQYAEAEDGKDKISIRFRNDWDPLQIARPRQAIEQCIVAESTINFNTTPGQTVARELLIAYLNTGTHEEPVWSPIGKRVEDSSAEYDWGEETKQDILGSTWTTMKKPTITQTFDPCELDAGDEAQKKIWNLAVVEQDAQALSNQDMLRKQYV